VPGSPATLGTTLGLAHRVRQVGRLPAEHAARRLALLRTSILYMTHPERTNCKRFPHQLPRNPPWRAAGRPRPERGPHWPPRCDRLARADCGRSPSRLFGRACSPPELQFIPDHVPAPPQRRSIRGLFLANSRKKIHSKIPCDRLSHQRVIGGLRRKQARFEECAITHLSSGGLLPILRTICTQNFGMPGDRVFFRNC
jgi:hypothetical protein